MRWLLRAIGVVSWIGLLALLVALLALPAPGPDPPLRSGSRRLHSTGVLAPNDRLARLRASSPPTGSRTPRSSSSTRDGRLYTGNAQGEILRVTLRGGRRAATIDRPMVGRPGGRPNGADASSPDGSLLVSDGYHAPSLARASRTAGSSRVPIPERAGRRRRSRRPHLLPRHRGATSRLAQSERTTCCCGSPARRRAQAA